MTRPKAGDVVSGDACRTCNGLGWVCEEHPDRAWDSGEGCCGAAGAPCGSCCLAMAAASLTEPLRELVVHAISLLESAERETNWGDPLFGPSPSEEIQIDLDALCAGPKSPAGEA